MPEFINDFLAIPLGCLAAGMLLPAVLSLRRSVQPGGRGKLVLRILSVLLLIPAVLLALYLFLPGWAPLLNRAVMWILLDRTRFRMRLAQSILPFLAGLCLYPAWVKLKQTGEGMEAR